MSGVSPKERLLRTLNKKKTDRPPVICPGGMMNAAVVDIMNSTGHTLPEAHHSEQLMSELAFDVYRHTGFENFGVPFCMTVEAEALGSSVDYGTLQCEPKIKKEGFASAGEMRFFPAGTMEKNARVGAVLQALHILSTKHTDVPAIGSLTGPLSTSASLVDPMTFLRQMRKDKEATHRLVDYVSGHLIEYARLMADNGAAAISIADPTATGEILGPLLFEEYAVPYINRIADAVHGMGVLVIIHICGEMRAVMPQAALLHGDAISVDAFVSLKKMKQVNHVLTTMGNLSTYLLEFGNPEKVSHATEKLLNDGIDIISPACGLSTSTPLANIRAFTTAVTEGR
jgi:Uroporphyrinogen-III decarboxylase